MGNNGEIIALLQFTFPPRLVDLMRENAKWLWTTLNNLSLA